MKKYFFIFLCLYSFPSNSYDGSYGFGGRWYPQSAGVFGQIGSSRMLWNDKSYGDLAYGFWRPYANGFSSITVNQLGVGVDVFPVSFLGATLHSIASHRSKNFADVPCDTNACQGNVYTTSLKTHILLGVGNWFFLWEREYGWAEPQDKTISFIDENTMLINNSMGDQFTYEELNLGYKFSDVWKSGINMYGTRITGTNNTNSQFSAWISFKNTADLSLTAGIGNYNSTLQTGQLTFYGVAKWNMGSGLSLIQ